MIVRAWNLYHGNTFPPGRRSYLREMVELITADGPGIVCLQEVPAWALERIGEWADMQHDAVRTRRPKLLLPIPAGVGRRVTQLNAGLLRSSANGQGNVILVPKDAKIRERKQITLNTNPFCEDEAEKLGLDAKMARRWQRERRVCHLVKIELKNRRRILVANLHASHFPDRRLADAELRRGAKFVDRASELEEIIVFAGDFNVTLEDSETLRELTTRDYDAYSATGPAIDHVLVREGRASDVRIWTEEERTYDGKLLSDHAPVELQLLGKARPKSPAAAAVHTPAEQPTEQPAPQKSEDDERWETKETGFDESERWETPP